MAKTNINPMAGYDYGNNSRGQFTAETRGLTSTYQSLETLTSSQMSGNITFSKFVQNVAKDNPATGKAYMGKVSFTEGLPESYTEGTMTVTVLSDGLVKYIFNSPVDPYSQYECYSVNGGEPTQWTKGEGGGGVADLMVETTWSNLVTLRDNSQLIPGMKYRITDYQCTTTQVGTQSANHPFDIIVTADSKNTLNENAKATVEGKTEQRPTFNFNGYMTYEGVRYDIKSRWYYDGEKYVDDAQQIMSVWLPEDPSSVSMFRVPILYTLQGVTDVQDIMTDVYININDTVMPYGTFSQFIQPTELYPSSGMDYNNPIVKPMLYWENSKLEAWGLKYCLDNDVNRFEWASSKSIIGWDNDGVLFWQNKTRIFNGEIYYKWETLSGDHVYYTLSPNPQIGDQTYWFEDDVIHDGSLVTKVYEDGKGVIFYMKDEYNNEAFYDFKNILFARYKITNIYDQNNNPIQHDLIGTYGEAITDDQNHVMVEVDLQDSIMCYTFSYTDSGDIIDASNYMGFNGYTPNMVSSNSIGIFGEYTTTPPNLAIKLGLSYVVFLSNINGSRFYGNKIGFGSGHLTFGNICHGVEIENNTQYCIFGEECNETNLASNCSYNVFGNDCRKNTLSEQCQINIFNSHISNNTIMSRFEDNLLGSYIENSTFFNGINHCNITGGSDNSIIQSVQILNGVANQTIGFTPGVGYTQVACLDSSNNLVVGTPTITV